MGADRVVLDSSALLAALWNEPGAEVVMARLESTECWISAVNLAELVGKLIDEGLPSGEIDALLGALRLELAVLDEARARRCAELRPQTRPLGLSLGDRACLALAMELDCPVVTADRAWGEARLPVEIVLLR